MSRHGLWQQIEFLFEHNEFYAAHELLERDWLEMPEGSERELFSTLILLSAALHKARIQGEPEPARRILERALAHLERTHDGCHGFSTHMLRRRIKGVLDRPDEIVTLPRRTWPDMILQS